MKLHLEHLSFLGFLIIAVAWITAWFLKIVTTRNLVSFILLSTGFWILIVAGLKAVTPEKGAFGTFCRGMLFTILGGVLYIVNSGIDLKYAFAFISTLVGIFVVVVILYFDRS
ncbi:MAG: hypothetical protein ACLFU9_05560 [Candidatus Bathyarchaeia archaeon]